MEETSPNNDIKMWSMLCHLSALSALIGVPFGNIIGPLLIWQIKKVEIPEMEEHGKEALNFQITATIVFLGLAVAVFISGLLSAFVIGLPFLFLFGLLLLVVTIGWLVVTIIAAVKANEGELYRYPLTIRMIK